MENNKNKMSVKFQGVMLNFYDFIQVFVFTTNHHLKILRTLVSGLITRLCSFDKWIILVDKLASLRTFVVLSGDIFTTFGFAFTQLAGRDFILCYPT